MIVYIAEGIRIDGSIVATDENHATTFKSSGKNTKKISDELKKKMDQCPIEKSAVNGLKMTKQGFIDMCKRTRFILGSDSKRIRLLPDQFSSEESCKKCKIKEQVEDGNLGDIEWVTWIEVSKLSTGTY